MIHYDELKTFDVGSLTVVVDACFEETDPYDHFDDSVDDVEQIREDIQSGLLDWFTLRVRVLLRSYELGVNYLGCCLYPNAKDVLSDGEADNLIQLTVEGAKQEIEKLKRELELFDTCSAV